MRVWLAGRTADDRCGSAVKVAPMAMHADRPSVIVAGSTGLVGRHLVKRLLADRHTGTVHALMRREVRGYPESKRLLKHVIRFDDLEKLPLAYECYIALGTTIRQAGSQAAFRTVDFDAVVAVARAARASGVARLALVSALGADELSTVFYNRVKGEAEDAVAALGFERVVIARPSLLMGNREEIGQPARPVEGTVQTLLRPVTRLVPAKWRPIEASVVARALVRTLRADGPSVQVLESAALLSAGT